MIFRRSRRRSHEVCVVGTGFAGTAIAQALARNGVDTIVLEAGSSVENGRGNRLTAPVNNGYAFPVDFNRSIAYGGTSRKWNGVLSRMLPTDFRSHSEFGLFTDWPIGYGEIEKFYPLAERFLHHSPDAHSNGIWPDFHAEFDLRREGFSQRKSTGQPVRLHEVETINLANHRNVTVLGKHIAARIHSQSGSATMLEALRADGSTMMIEAERFVIAAGVVETVRLLLNSRSTRSANGLGNDHDQLGRYLNTHPRPRLHVGGAQQPDLVGLFRTARYCDSNRRAGLGAVCVDLNYFEPEMAIDLTIETEPSAHNRIIPAAGVTEHDLAAVQIVGSESEIDRRTWTAALALQREIAHRIAPGAPVRMGDLDIFHPAGGCRMAREEQFGVTDENCRVFGTDNVYVSGASLFPTSGALNPTLTVVALALRLAEHFRPSALKPFDSWWR